MGNVPHSVVLWTTLEIHERKPDGNITGMPVVQRKFNGITHFENLEEAQEGLEKLKEKIKNVQTT